MKAKGELPHGALPAPQPVLELAEQTFATEVELRRGLDLGLELQQRLELLTRLDVLTHFGQFTERLRQRV
ncbi:MAG: hypothetical protein AAGD86_03140 [Pseudomonadota bacterium]